MRSDLTASRCLRVALAISIGAHVSSLATPARARDASPPAAHDDDAFDLMNVLTWHGFHDINDESWNVYGQFTYITSYKPAFNAPYTNANGSASSLWPQAERGFTTTATLFMGLRTWTGGELYFVPETIAERAFSQLRGIGGATENFELQKTGSDTPLVYRSRLYFRQTIGLGGDREVKTSDPMRLGTTVDRRRLVFTVGNFSVLDVFNRNTILGDPRRGFFNESFMTDSSYDFPAEARGYTWGGAVELFWDAWSIRFGRFAPPANPNAQQLDLRLWEHYGDSLEVQHGHVLFGQPGSVHVLGYRNHEVTGNFDDAIAAFKSDPSKNAAACGALYNYGSANFTAPDLCWVRKVNVKLGLGINVEQSITSDIGVFIRGMYSDGKTEVDAYDSADRDISFGAVIKGSLWHRRFDNAGAAFAASWISDSHAQFLAMGGVDGFIGDGHLNNAVESLVEAFYSLNLFKAIWLSVDYQRMWNPGYNADRGPLNIFAGRVHAEF